MKKFITLSLIVILSSCKQNEDKTITTTESDTAPTPELSVAQKIANAHGFDQWDKVNTFHFTFGGKLEDPTSGRSWVWHPKTDDITLVRAGDTINYNRKSMDSIALKADRGFINDKFWALIPFQLIWDTSATISEPEKARSPIHQKDINKITITYANEGGYTPGDAYDIYYDNDFIIREWSYRRGNAKEASLSNTFENYSDYKGIKVAQEHKKGDDEWNLLVWKVRVELEE